MDEGVLAWEGDVNANPCLDEDVSVVMESIKCIFKTVEILSRYSIAAHNVAEIKECQDAFDHVCRDMSDNCTKVNLYV